MPRAVDLRLVAERLRMPQRWGSFEIGGTFGGTAPRGRAPGEAAKPISYSESGADGRIRTGDPLFTKQLLCQAELRRRCRSDYMRGLRAPPNSRLGGVMKSRPSYAPAPGG